jgi:hypothetical protein
VALAYPPLPGKSYHPYPTGAIHIILNAYLFGAAITAIGGTIALEDRYRRGPKTLTRFNGKDLFSANFWLKRLTVVGVLFLLAPLWCLPIINGLAIKIAGETVRYGSFMTFDVVCVGLQADTLMILFRIGFYVTLTGILASAIREYLSSRSKP